MPRLTPYPPRMRRPLGEDAYADAQTESSEAALSLTSPREHFNSTERLGISPAYLSRVERGKERPPRPELVKRMAALLGGSPDLLFRLAESTDPAAPCSGKMRDRWHVRLTL